MSNLSKRRRGDLLTPVAPGGGGVASSKQAQALWLKLQQALKAVEAQLGRLIASTSTPQDKQLSKLELAFLRRLRGTLLANMHNLPQDVVLLEGMGQYLQEISENLTALQEGGVRRLWCLLNFECELCSELVVLEHTTAAKSQLSHLRSQLRQAKERLQALGWRWHLTLPVDKQVPPPAAPKIRVVSASTFDGTALTGVQNLLMRIFGELQGALAEILPDKANTFLDDLIEGVFDTTITSK